MAPAIKLLALHNGLSGSISKDLVALPLRNIQYQMGKCINEFHHIFKYKEMARLNLYADEYSISGINELSSFVKGLNKDMDAVENTVTSNLSNNLQKNQNGVTILSKKYL